ncbi:hypothetical protein DXV75_09425 [Alteromonas aestuariivivens]|uniref:Prokaryotic glutathione synthetase ATP-binding domain-containing protein n=1 Tax=Alteromonas aestuariivivens TaxID=1938339 RepID=A0A3D8M7E2_9ALTE|nr:hypothetical protein [Alteromonas aestuariivivens]RDV25509.1 hypothetical protein DXV75_09425 [Alteromonas aestuariivivens]
MSRVAFLSMDNLEDFFVYDDLLAEPLARAGWQVSSVPWRDSAINWNDYDVVVVRSCWDYQQSPQEFEQCLRRINESSAQLQNPLDLMLWNLHKTYLKELAEKGVPIVPTAWAEHFNRDWLEQQFACFNADELIIKPVLSANADDTFRLTLETLDNMEAELGRLFSHRAHMVQPFVGSVVSEGEYSLFYFSGQYSHAILKKPKHGDFRVQEEHGGALLAVEADEALRQLSHQALAAMPASALYARVDVIRTPAGWAIMELELIEPSLYFNLDPQSPQRFVDAFVALHGAG